MNPFEALLYRAFGRPTGILGSIGGRILARMNGDVARQVVELLALEPDDRVLEVGFGPGVGIELAAAAVPDGFVAGADPSEQMFVQARKRNRAAIETGRVDLRLAVAAELPFDDGSFDAAFAVNSTPMWPDPVAGLREVRRVLRPGGQIAVTLTPHAGGSPDDLRSQLADAGFERIRTESSEDWTAVIAVRPGQDHE